MVFSRNRHIILTAIVILAFSVTLFLQYKDLGFVWGFESDKYINAAKKLVQGDTSDLKLLYPYGSFIIFLGAFFSISTSYYLPVFFVIGLHLFSMRLLFRLLEKYQVHYWIIYAALLAYATNYILHINTLSLFTEPLFTTCSTIVFCWIGLVETIKLRRNFLFWILLLFIIFLRPFGIVFSFAFGALVLFQNQRNSFVLKLLYVGLGLIVIAILCAPVPHEYVALPIAQGCAIYGIGMKDASDYSGHNFLSANVYFLVKHGIFDYLSLWFSKVVYFLIPFRTYFTWKHNLVVIFSSFLFYPFIAVLIGKWSKNLNLFQKTIVLALLAYTILIGFTWVEWHERFTTPIIPFLIYLGALGADKIFNRKVDI